MSWQVGFVNISLLPDLWVYTIVLEKLGWNDHRILLIVIIKCIVRKQYIYWGNTSERAECDYVHKNNINIPIYGITQETKKGHLANIGAHHCPPRE